MDLFYSIWVTPIIEMNLAQKFVLVVIFGGLTLLWDRIFSFLGNKIAKYIKKE